LFWETENRKATCASLAVGKIAARKKKEERIEDLTDPLNREDGGIRRSIYIAD
jgi:hypothetical protein